MRDVNAPATRHKAAPFDRGNNRRDGAMLLRARGGRGVPLRARGGVVHVRARQPSPRRGAFPKEKPTGFPVGFSFGS